MALNLYTPDGWLDFESIYKAGMTFTFIIGSRQVGKTFGSVKYFTENQKKIVFMRRTSSELEFACSDSESAIFAKLGNYMDCSYQFKKVNQFVNTIDVKHGSNEWNMGICTALTSLAHIRGFNGDPYECVLYDEFIPETCVKKMTGEGAAFVNGYITLNGNRELEGRAPLRVVCLANANTLDSPILNEFRLTQKVEQMVKNGQEYSLMPDRGVLIVIPKSEKITGERAKTALYLATGTDSDAAKMALNNQFSYNDFSDVRHVTLDAQWNCLFELKGKFIWQNKVTGEYYICSKKAGSPKKIWKMTGKGVKKFLIDHGHESFLIAQFMHKIVYASYEEKVLVDEAVNSTRRINL